MPRSILSVSALESATATSICRCRLGADDEHSARQIWITAFLTEYDVQRHRRDLVGMAADRKVLIAIAQKTEVQNGLLAWLNGEVVRHESAIAEAIVRLGELLTASTVAHDMALDAIAFARAHADNWLQIPGGAKPPKLGG